MKYSFALSKDIVLSATYETLVFHSEYETFGADEVHKRVEGHFGAGFVRRMLSSLAKDGLITLDQYDESSPAHYTLSDEGFQYVEGLPTLTDLLGSESNIEDDSSVIPASDRFVTLSDNQQSKLEITATELIDEVEKANGIDGDPTFRQIVIGQLKAGRELIRATIFDVQIMHLTLIETLKLLVKRYDQGVIGSLAGALLIELAKIHGFLQ